MDVDVRESGYTHARRRRPGDVLMTHPKIAVTRPPAASPRRSKFVQRSNVWLCSREVLVGSVRRLRRLASDLRAVGAARGQASGFARARRDRGDQHFPRTEPEGSRGGTGGSVLSGIRSFARTTQSTMAARPGLPRAAPQPGRTTPAANVACARGQTSSSAFRMILPTRP